MFVLLAPFTIFVSTKISCGSGWASRKCDFCLPLLSPFAIFVIG